jgi:hypothetical protein
MYLRVCRMHLQCPCRTYHIYIYIYVYVYISIFMYIHMLIYINLYTYVCIYTYMLTWECIICIYSTLVEHTIIMPPHLDLLPNQSELYCICISICVFIYIYIYICKCICIYIYIYIYIYLYIYMYIYISKSIIMPPHLDLLPNQSELHWRWRYYMYIII